MYEVNETLVLIPTDIITKIRGWNTSMFRNDTNYDMKIVQALLVLCVGSDVIIAGDISEKVLKFVKGKKYQNPKMHTSNTKNNFIHINRISAHSCSR